MTRVTFGKDFVPTTAARKPTTFLDIPFAGEDPGRYIRRDVLNAADIISWAKSQGCDTCLPPEDMHVTITYSKVWFPWEEATDTIEPPRTGRKVSAFNDGATVLEFEAPVLTHANERMRAAGAVSSYPEFRPHITLTYKPVNLSDFETMYDGPIILGPEITAPVQSGWKDNLVEKTMKGKILKIDDEQRLVYGWISVVEKDGKPVEDLQGDIIPVDELVKMAHGYVRDARVAKMMHDGEQVGELVESMVFTREVQKALGIDLKEVGWWGVYKIADDKTWAMVKSGNMASFSIGGHGDREEVKT